MEMRQKRISVYKTMMRRRTLTNWANSVLRSADKQIVDIFNPNERVLLEGLSQIVLARSAEKFKDVLSSRERKEDQRKAVLSKAEEFKRNYFKAEQGQGNYRNTFNHIWSFNLPLSELMFFIF